MKLTQKNFKIIPKLEEFNIYADGIEYVSNEVNKITKDVYLREFDPVADFRGFKCRRNDKNLTKLGLDIFKDGKFFYCLDLQFYIEIVDTEIDEFNYSDYYVKIWDLEYALVKNNIKKGFLKNVVIAANAIAKDFVE